MLNQMHLMLNQNLNLLPPNSNWTKNPESTTNILKEKGTQNAAPSVRSQDVLLKVH